MNNLSSFLEKKLLPLANKMSSQKYLKAVSSSFMTLIPFLTIGSIALVLISPPIASDTMDPGLLKSFIQGWEAMAAALKVPLGAINSICMDFMALYIAAAMGFFLARDYKIKGYLPPVLTTASFLILSTINADSEKIFDYFGGQGLFTAILSSILAIELLRVLKEKKVGYISLEGQGVPEALTESFALMVPTLIVLIVIAIIHTIILSSTGNVTPALIAVLMEPLISFTNSLPGVLFLAFLVMTFWWFGIHDTCITGPMKAFWYTALAANITAYAAGTPSTELPYIMTYPFWFMFLMIGGSGATFGLCLLLLFGCKSKQLKTVGKLGIVPGFFNINEPIIFGVPLMLNPLMYIPFVGSVMANGLITYLCMNFGIIGRTVADPSWNMFCPIGALISTMDIKAMLLVVFLIILDIVIYFPFIKVYDNQKLKEENETIEA